MTQGFCGLLFLLGGDGVCGGCKAGAGPGFSDEFFFVCISE